MSWRFWEPKHTVGSVARELITGLRDGSIVLDKPLDDESFDDDEQLVLQLDIPAGTSNEQILEMVKQCVLRADEENRHHGGRGLTLEAVRVDSPKLKVALRELGDAI